MHPTRRNPCCFQASRTSRFELFRQVGDRFREAEALFLVSQAGLPVSGACVSRSKQSCKAGRQLCTMFAAYQLDSSSGAARVRGESPACIN